MHLQPQISPQKLRLLILEDNGLDAELMVEELRSSGFEPEWRRVETESDFVEALTSKVDVILADSNLPEFDGLRALALTRQLEPRLPFLVVSGSMGDELAAQCIKRGATDYLLKDRLARLGPAVSNALEERRRRAEREEAQEALVVAEAKFRRLVEQSLVGIYVIQDARFAYVNPRLAEILGCSQEEMLGQPVQKFIAEADWPLVSQNLNKRLDGKIDSIRYELRMIHADGKLIHVEVQGSRSEYNSRPAILGTLLDVTEQKRAENRVQTHQSITQAISDSTTVPEAALEILKLICENLHWDCGLFWTVNPQKGTLRCLTTWNSSRTGLQEFLDTSRDLDIAPGAGLPGKVWSSHDPVWINSLDPISLPLRKNSIEPFGLCSAVAFPILAKEEVWGVIELFSTQPLKSDNELLGMFSTVGTHVGEFMARKQLEDQLRQSQKMEAFGQLAGGVAHDFNNLLAVIMGYVSIVKNERNLSSKAVEQLNNVYAAGERAANLTRQMLTFSRKKEMVMSPTDLGVVIANMKKMLDRIIGENISIEYHCPATLPSIRADHGMMEQVLMNLVVNARDAMPKGGRLFISTEPIRIDGISANSPARRPGDFICLAVKDTGSGMSKEVMTRIFEPFFTTKEVGKGTGLGLATVYGIVKEHQGWVEVDSEVGVGTTFQIYLPSAPALISEKEAKPKETKPNGGTETILLVEDEDAVRGLAALILRQNGYTVLEAPSGSDAIPIWEEHEAKIDLLLTDMVMPGEYTGRELAERLRQTKPDLKVVYASGYSIDMTDPSFQSEEHGSFLQKPYHPSRLTETVRRVLDQKKD